VAVRQSQWVVETEAKLRLEVLSMEGLRRLLRQAAAMEPGRLVEVASRRVRELLTAAQDWENEAKAAVKQRPPHPASYLENLLAKAQHISVQLPSRSLLEEGLGRAAEWRRQAQLLQDNDSHPHYDHLKSLLASGRPIAVKLDLLAQLESRHAAAKGWVDRAGRTFIKKNSVVSLLEVLLPRTRAQFFQRFSQSGKSGKKKTESAVAVVGELEVGRSPLSDLGGDRLKEMEKIHSMEEEEDEWAHQQRRPAGPRWSWASPSPLPSAASRPSTWQCAPSPPPPSASAALPPPGSCCSSGSHAAPSSATGWLSRRGSGALSPPI
jgi:hypothetical protein